MQIRLLALILGCALLMVMFVHINSISAFPLVAGDVDADGMVNISDAVYLITYIFGNGNEPPCFRCTDVDDDCMINISDVVRIISYIFGPDQYPLVLGCEHQEINTGCVTYPKEGGKGDYEQAALSRGCLEGPVGGADSGWLYLEIIGDDLHVHHINAYYQCCLGYKVDFFWQDYRHVTVQEYDTVEVPCPCMCYFNLESVIYDLMIMEPTTFVVTLIGIEGDTVGVDSISLGDNGYLYTEVLGNDLHLHHINAFYQCCLEYAVDYQINGFNITATEADTGMPCDCMCYFNLESILYDLENGVYVVCLIDAMGNTVGVDTVTVNAGYGLLGYSDSGCLKDPAAGDPPDIAYTYSTAGVLTMTHNNAFFNCAAKLVVAFEQAADTLRFYKFNISNDYAYCMCYYNISAAVGGILPGEYIAEVYEQQYPGEPIQMVDNQQIVLGN